MAWGYGTDGKIFHLLRGVIVSNMRALGFFNGNVVSDLSVGDA